MCNHVYYTLLHASAQDASRRRSVIFIHLPQTTEQVLQARGCEPQTAHFYPLDALVAATEVVLEDLVRQYEENIFV